MEHIQLNNFRLWTCLWTPNAYMLLAQKVFLFQMLGESSLFTLPLWQKYQNDVLCGSVNMDVSPLTYWNLNSFSKIIVLQWLLGFMLVYFSQKVKRLPKKVCLIIIHRNTTHILDMSCCHKHQQQKYHHENTKICLFIHYTYVDILFPLQKPFQLRLNVLPRVIKLYKTWIGHNATRYHNFNALPNTLPHVLLFLFVLV